MTTSTSRDALTNARSILRHTAEDEGSRWQVAAILSLGFMENADAATNRSLIRLALEIANDQIVGEQK